MNNPFNSIGDLNPGSLALSVALAGSLLLNGCAQEPSLKVPPVPPKEPVVITTPLETHDQTITASELKQPESPSISRQQIPLRLEAVEQLIQSGEFEQAKKEADGIDSSQLTDQEHNLLLLLYAQISLSMGEAEQALENIKHIQPHLLNLPQQIHYFKAQAFAFSLSGRVLDSAESRIELIPLLTTSESQDQNQRDILETLSLLDDQDLDISLQNSTGSMTGWLELARLYKRRTDPDFAARLGQWRETFPDHPANLAILTNTAGSTESTVHYPGSIAVMLPASGPFAEAGRAVKAGLMAAFANVREGSYKPNLQFYDTTEASPVEHYLQAVAGGAEFIIGPLEKKDIQSLADSTSLSVPVLALNHIQNLEQDNLYQFALSPMDDVREITERARLDGHKKAALLLPENSQTQRIIEYFKEYWPDGDRVLSKIQTYHPKAVDFSSSIRILLNRDTPPASQPDPIALPEVEETKTDLDAIFFSAYSNEARTIKQQLNADGTHELAVYALPNIYFGQPNPVEDQILNGVSFCDMPWFFNSGDQGNLGMKSLASVWRQFPNSYLRLIAMGIDAFNLSGRLNDLNNKPYLGATGKLTLAEDNRIKRDLVCAKFTEGQPRVYDFINRPGAQENNTQPVLEDSDDTETTPQGNILKDDPVQ